MMTEKALTLEQLQKMRGKWVWIVSPDKDLTVSGWAYVGKDHVYTYWEYERDELVGRVVYNICDYGAWLAYENPTAINPEDLSIAQKLREQLEHVTAERDAAVSDLENIMAYNSDTCQSCKNNQCYVRGGTKPCLPKWRGPQKENDYEKSTGQAD